MIVGIDQAIKHIDGMIKNLKNNKQFFQDLADYGAARARMYLEHIDTGETINSITATSDNHSATVTVGGHAIWIEFGTGVYNAAYPYSTTLAEGIAPHGEYGEHGKQIGWWYPDPDGTHVYNGQTWSYTYGMASNPFMTKALYDMVRYIKQHGGEEFTAYMGVK